MDCYALIRWPGVKQRRANQNGVLRMTRLPIAAVARSIAIAGLVAASPAVLGTSAMAATAGGVTDELGVVRIPKGRTDHHRRLLG